MFPAMVVLFYLPTTFTSENPEVLLLHSQPDWHCPRSNGAYLLEYDFNSPIAWKNSGRQAHL